MAFQSVGGLISVNNDFIIVALGANQSFGTTTPRQTLIRALDEMAAEGLVPVARSRWFKCPAFPAGAGPDFVNAVAVIECDLAASDVLATLHRVEDKLGRTRSARWEARVCDLDLIAFGDAISPDIATVTRWIDVGAGAAGAMPAPDRLILPHPRMQERGFVLVPLCDVAPDWRHPVLGQTALALRDQLPDAARAEVEPIDD